MSSSLHWVLRVSVFVIAMVLSACGGSSAKRVYEDSTYGPPLEVPPDLTIPAGDESLELPVTGGRPATVPAPVAEEVKLAVLPDQENIVLMRDGAQRWLVLNGEPSQVWPWVRSFWMKRGVRIKFEDPVAAILETDWIQQQVNFPGNPTPVAKDKEEPNKVYAVPMREKYRVRLERGDKPGTTELYLTHRGVELSDQDGMLAWRLRPSDRELEAEHLRDLMAFLGIEQGKTGGVLASPKEIVRRATLNTDAQGISTLHMDEEFASAWRRVELALDRLGYQIEDRDRSRGVFYVVAKNSLEDLSGEKKRSWWARLLGKDKEGQNQYQVVLKDEGEAANLYVRSKAGDKLDNTLSEPVLRQLQEHLK